MAPRQFCCLSNRFLLIVAQGILFLSIVLLYLFSKVSLQYFNFKRFFDDCCQLYTKVIDFFKLIFNYFEVFKFLIKLVYSTLKDIPKILPQHR